MAAIIRWLPGLMSKDKLKARRDLELISFTIIRDTHCKQVTQSWGCVGTISTYPHPNPQVRAIRPPGTDSCFQRHQVCKSAFPSLSQLSIS